MPPITALSAKQAEAMRVIASADPEQIRGLAGRTVYSLQQRGLIRRTSGGYGPAEYAFTDAGAHWIVDSLRVVREVSA